MVVLVVDDDDNDNDDDDDDDDDDAGVMMQLSFPLKALLAAYLFPEHAEAAQIAPAAASRRRQGSAVNPLPQSNFAAAMQHPDAPSSGRPHILTITIVFQSIWPKVKCPSSRDLPALV